MLIRIVCKISLTQQLVGTNKLSNQVLQKSKPRIEQIEVSRLNKMRFFISLNLRIESSCTIEL